MVAEAGVVSYDPADEQPQSVALSTSASVEYDVIVQKDHVYYVWMLAKCDADTPTGKDGFMIWDGGGIEHIWAGLREASGSGWLKAPVALEFEQRKQFSLKFAPLGGKCSISQLYVGSAETHIDVSDSPEFVQPGGGSKRKEATTKALLGEARHSKVQQQLVHADGKLGEAAHSEDPELQLQQTLEKARVATERVDELQAGMATALSDLYERKHASITDEQRQ